MKKVNRVVGVLLCFLLTGCAAPVIPFIAGGAVGIAGYKFYEGGLTVIYRATYMETWDGTLEALKQLNFRIEKSEHDLTSGKIVSKRADGKPVTINIKYKSANETEVDIRVGHLGDREASIAIKDKIRAIVFNEQ